MDNIFVILERRLEAVVIGLQISPEKGVVKAMDKSLEFSPLGPVGDRHSTKFFYSNARQSYVHRGTRHSNYRPGIITSDFEAREAANLLGLPDIITADDLSTNIHLAGNVRLSTLPASTVIRFCEKDSKETELALTLRLTGRNTPCDIFRVRIEKRLGTKIDPKIFDEVMQYRRGCTFTVDIPGKLWLQTKAKILVPEIGIPMQLLQSLGLVSTL